MRLSKSLRARRRIEQAELVRRSRAGVVSNFVTSCELHSGWRVDVSDGRMPPPAEACPHCYRDSIGTRNGSREKREVDVADIGAPVTPRQFELLQLYLEKHPEKVGIAGTAFEEDLIELIDLERENEIDRDRRELQNRPGPRVFLNQFGDQVTSSGDLLAVPR